MKKVDLIVPCFNESDVLKLFYNEVEKVLSKCEGYKFRYIFVDDGSRDNTLEIMKELAEKDNRVKYISFSRNFGKEAAMLAGMKNSNAEYVGIIDADLQHSPNLIPQMLEALEEGYDVAAAKRSDREGEHKFKSFLSSKFYGVINKVSEIDIEQSAQDYRIMKHKVVDSIISVNDYTRFSKGIFTWVGFKVKWFEHENSERAAGETKWSLKSLLKYALDGIYSFSSYPLKIPVKLGAVSLAIGIIYAIALIICAFVIDYNNVLLRIPIAFILIFGGVILMSIGVIGEYIARIFSQVKGRPNFIVDETNIEDIK